jgi:hypothetical protein
VRVWNRIALLVECRRVQGCLLLVTLLEIEFEAEVWRTFGYEGVRVPGKVSQ